LDDVSFSIAPQTITALVGPNGAGKTTLLRCLVALDRPGAGRVLLDELDVHESPREAHKRMAFLPDFFGVYDDLTVRQCLEYRARARRSGRTPPRRYRTRRRAARHLRPRAVLRRPSVTRPEAAPSHCPGHYSRASGCDARRTGRRARPRSALQPGGRVPRAACRRHDPDRLVPHPDG